MPGMSRPMGGRGAGSGDGGDTGFAYRWAVGRWVASHRKKAGLTQKELGKVTGVGPQAISMIETGRNPVPPERYRDFQVALGVAPKVFGKFILEHTDPWVFGMIYGEDAVRRHNLDQIPDRGEDRRKDE